MSPEQSDSSKHVTIRSDIYSLGATLYHLMSGMPPYEGLTELEMLGRLFSGEGPLPLRDVTEGSIPPVLELLSLLTFGQQRP